MVWVIRLSQARIYDPGVNLTITLFDLAIASLITVSVVLMGQAMASYEIFTGRSIPRQGLGRLWRRAVILAIGYSILMAGSLVIFDHPIYSILLSAVLIVVFVAVLGRRTFDERENLMDSLRPFVSSQGVFDQMFSKTPQIIDVQTPFAALCEEVLGTEQAYLTALGPLESLLESDLTFPLSGTSSPPPEMDAILTTPGVVGIPLNTVSDGEWMWAVPLWNVSGLAGALYLGARNDGGLYTQEEIDIARITGERLLDTLASAEITRRLMQLQRQQMAEGQVLDRRTRRILHDDVLPQIHATMLSMSANRAENTEALATLSGVHQQIAALLRDVPTTETSTLAEWGLISGIRRIAFGEFGEAFDEIDWLVDPGADEVIGSLPSISAEVMFYAAREAIRNAAQHGRLTDQPLSLNVLITDQQGIQITIRDDGVGIDEAKNFDPGHGLELHRTLMSVIGGKLEIESQPEAYTLVRLSLPETK